MNGERDKTPNEPSDERPDSGVHAPECAECMEARHEIMMAIFPEAETASESAAMHMSRCVSCRDWERDLRRMHSLCGCAGGAADPAPLTAAAVGAAAPAAAGVEGPAAQAGVRWNFGVLGVVLIAAALANIVLSLFLPGGSRIFYPVLLFALMLVAAVWVFRDARRRGLRSGFWAALQPFTLPAGFITYLVCRERASLRCPGCGALASTRARFCANCGTQLQDGCCHCGNIVRREFRVCPWCGVPLADCFPGEESAGSSCGWSRAQAVFIAAANTVLFVLLLAVILVDAAPRTTAFAALYLLGLFPVLNWVAFDSRRRAMNTIGWSALAVFGGYVGLVVYLGCRRELVVEWPVCGGFPPASFNFCPCCGSLINRPCPRCGAAVVSGSYCATCGAPLG